MQSALDARLLPFPRLHLHLPMLMFLGVLFAFSVMQGLFIGIISYELGDNNTYLYLRLLLLWSTGTTSTIEPSWLGDTSSEPLSSILICRRSTTPQFSCPLPVARIMNVPLHAQVDWRAARALPQRTSVNRERAPRT